MQCSAQHRILHAQYSALNTTSACMLQPLACMRTSAFLSFSAFPALNMKGTPSQRLLEPSKIKPSHRTQVTAVIKTATIEVH
jgi:hypothetical protein